jgi:hypothetical protein
MAIEAIAIECGTVGRSLKLFEVAHFYAFRA